MGTAKEMVNELKDQTEKLSQKAEEKNEEVVPKKTKWYRRWNCHYLKAQEEEKNYELFLKKWREMFQLF